MSKRKVITNYLLENDKEKLTDMIENRLTQAEVARYFNVTRAFVNVVVSEIEPNFLEKHQIFIKQRLSEILNLWQYGITLDVLFDHGFLKDIVDYNDDLSRMRIHLITRMLNCELITNREKHMLPSVPMLKSIIKNCLIDLLDREGIKRFDIANQLGISLSAVNQCLINRDMFGVTMPHASQTLYNQVKCNLLLYESFKNGYSIEDLYNKYQDNYENILVVQMVIETLKKYN